MKLFSIMVKSRGLAYQYYSASYATQCGKKEKNEQKVEEYREIASVKKGARGANEKREKNAGGKDGGDEITCKKDNAPTWGEKALKREDERSPFVFPR